MNQILPRNEWFRPTNWTASTLRNHQRIRGQSFVLQSSRNSSGRVKRSTSWFTGHSKKWHFEFWPSSKANCSYHGNPTLWPETNITIFIGMWRYSWAILRPQRTVQSWRWCSRHKLLVYGRFRRSRFLLCRNISTSPRTQSKIVFISQDFNPFYIPLGNYRSDIQIESHWFEGITSLVKLRKSTVFTMNVCVNTEASPFGDTALKSLTTWVSLPSLTDASFACTEDYLQVFRLLTRYVP